MYVYEKGFCQWWFHDGENGKMNYRSKFNKMGNVSKSFGGYWGCLNLFLVYHAFG